MRVEFVSYDGTYPNLCSGDLVISVDGVECNLGTCLSSGGGFDDDWCATSGPWSISDYYEWPENFTEEMKTEVVRLANENIPQGCCGGCA